MKIALDYDQTYSLAPAFWDEFIDLAAMYQHEVKIVTARNPVLDDISEDIHPGIEVIYCDGVAKRFVCHHFQSWDPDVWIDDKPESVDNNSTATKDILAKWRAEREPKLNAVG